MKHERMDDHTHVFRDVLMGLARIHVLQLAASEPTYGVQLSEALAERGYPLSPGTLYPMLHSLAEVGFLRREDRVVEGKLRKYYRTTALGGEALQSAGVRLRELLTEIDRSSSARSRSRSRPKSTKSKRS